MAVFSRQELITQLLDRTEILKASTLTFLRLTDDQLQYRPGPGQWSIVEIFGHLDLSMDFYSREILSRITLAPDNPSDMYRSSLLGDWLYQRIMPRPDGTVFKFKARRSLCAGSQDQDGKEVIRVFQRHCDAIDDILRYVATKDLRRISIPFYFPGILRLRLGDMLRYLVAHGERHLLQAQRVMTQVVPS
jgi:DinB superfamily